MTQSESLYFSDTGNVAELRAFVDKYPDRILIPEHGIPGNVTLLHVAARYGNIDLCKYLVELGIPVNSAAGYVGNKTPLCVAADKGHFALVRWLLENGSLVDGPSDCISTPLMNAVKSGHRDVVKILLSYRAEVNRLHLRYNKTPLDLAYTWGQYQIAKDLEHAGGIRVADQKPDWSIEFGGSIIDYIDKKFGPVLPIKYTQIVENTTFDLRISCISGGINFKALFSVGLFVVTEPHIELMIILPGNWPINNSGREEGGVLSFPERIILRLAEEVRKGLVVKEGFVVASSDPMWQDLAWPSHIASLIATDIRSDEEDDYEDTQEDIVTILNLIPYKKDKAPTGVVMEQWLKKNREAKWRKIALPSLEEPAPKRRMK